MAHDNGFPDGSDDKESACNAGDLGLIPGLGRAPGGGHGTTSVFLLGEFHGQKSLVGHSPWGHKESDTTKRLSLHFMLVRLIFEVTFGSNCSFSLLYTRGQQTACNGSFNFFYCGKT